MCDAFFPNVSLDNAASEGVLASFFNSLLSKKTGSPGSPGAGGVQSTAKKSGTERPWRLTSLLVEGCWRWELDGRVISPDLQTLGLLNTKQRKHFSALY